MRSIEPGIHFATGDVDQWIPGPRKKARPGMTRPLLPSGPNIFTNSPCTNSFPHTTCPVFSGSSLPSVPEMVPPMGYGLTTAQILYRMPDHPSLLQTYVWQNYDLFPKFPALQDFLAFWQEKLDGPLYSVIVGHSRLIKPAEFRAIDGVFRLH
jgi:uncharacterized protein Usg